MGLPFKALSLKMGKLSISLYFLMFLLIFSKN